MKKQKTSAKEKTDKQEYSQMDLDSIEVNADVLHEEKQKTKELQQDTEISFDNEVVEEKLEEALSVETPKKKRKSRITNLIFLAINIIFMSIIVSSFLRSIGDGMDLKSVLIGQGDRLWWLVLGLVGYLLFLSAETLIFSSLIKASTGKRHFGLSYRVAITGQYYDNITPLAVGGQPFQIVTLTRSGMSTGIATSLPVIKVIIYNIIYTFMVLLFYIFGVPFIATTSALNNFLMILLEAVAGIGLIFTTLTSVLFVLIGSGKIVGRGLARWLVRIGYGLHIVKDYRKTYNKLMLQVREYQNSMAFLRKNKKVMVECVLYCLLEMVALWTIPFSVVLAFSGTANFSLALWIASTIRIIICNMAATVVPLPGGTGMMEIGFILAFSSAELLGDNVVWGLLAWRIITYYLLILHGFIHTMTESIINAVRRKKNLNSI